jgi:hypothetical protein
MVADDFINIHIKPHLKSNNAYQQAEKIYEVVCSTLALNKESYPFTIFKEVIGKEKSYVIEWWIYRIKLTPRKGYGSEGLKCL